MTNRCKNENQQRIAKQKLEVKTILELLALRQQLDETPYMAQEEQLLKNLYPLE